MVKLYRLLAFLVSMKLTIYLVFPQMRNFGEHNILRQKGKKLFERDDL